VKSKLVYFKHLSGDKASVYSIVSEESKSPLLDHFISTYKSNYTQDLISIVGRLKSIGNSVGALETYFKHDEGLEWDDLVCALYDIPDKHLRLYCIRLSEHIIVVGNGGPKNVRAWQDDTKLSREVNEMMHYSKIIRTKLKDGSLRISEDGLKFEGDLMLTR
jgi:DNA-binding protein Fis